MQMLLPGPHGVFICNECVRLCRKIIADDPSIPESTEPGFESMKPAGIRQHLDEHVIGQDRAKVALSVAVYNHFKRIRPPRRAPEEPTARPPKRARTLAPAPPEVELSKGNILLIGPTGSGKTLLARTLARRLGVPFTMADATSLTEAGYVGEDVESIVKNLWIEAGRDAELAGKGIVCIDEIDKITRSGGSASSVRDVGGEGVQQALLKLLESQKVMIPPDQNRGRPQQDLVTIDTTHILFICCGAFQGLDRIVERRVASSRIGFGADPVSSRRRRSELLQQVRGEDLIQFGLIPEFVGRLPVIVALDELEEKDLVEILWKPRNALVRQYRRMFELEGIRLRFHHEALVALVSETIGRGTGARGLRAILETLMLDLMFELPSLQGVDTCVITEEFVRGAAPPLLLPTQAA